MRSLLPLLLLVAAAAATPASSTAFRTRRDAESEINNGGLAESPVSAALDAEVFGADPGQRTDREKRLLLEQKVQIGNSVKSAVLNLIFGKINSVIDSKSALLGAFERANAAKNLALLGPGTKRPPASSGIKGILSGVLSSSLGSSTGVLGSSSGSLSGGGGGASDSGAGAGDGAGAGASFGASLGGSIGGSAPGGGTDASSSSSSSASAGGYP